MPAWVWPWNQDACIQTLDQCGFLPTGPVGLVDLGNIPDGLDAEETERFLRDNGAEICDPGGTRDSRGPECAVTHASEACTPQVVSGGGTALRRANQTKSERRRLGIQSKAARKPK
jgi:hypothetical protein